MNAATLRVTGFAFTIGLGAALLVVFDPSIAGLLPYRLWARLHMENWPIKLVPFVALGVLLAWIVLPRLARDPLTSYIFLLFLAAQTNGIRIGPLDLFDGVLLIGVALWLAGSFGRNAQPIVMSSVVWFGLLLVMVALPHVIVESPVRFVVGMVGLVRAVLVAFILTNLVQDRDLFARLLRIFVIVACLSAIFGILQVVANLFLGITFTLIDPPETAFKPTPIGVVLRASGLCLTAQHQSSFLALALPIAAWQATTTWRLRDIAVLGIIGFGLILTWNMGGILSAAVVMAAFPFVRWPAYSIHYAAAYVLIGVAMFYFGLVDWIAKEVFDAGTWKGASQRGTLLELGLEKIDRSVLVGTGPQGFGTFHGNFWHRPVHNAYIQAATELGLFGALIFAAMNLWLLTLLVLTRAISKGEDRSLLTVLIMMHFILMSIFMTEPNLDHSNTWLMLGMIQAAILILAASASRPALRPATQ